MMSKSGVFAIWLSQRYILSHVPGERTSILQLTSARSCGLVSVDQNRAIPLGSALLPFVHRLHFARLLVGTIRTGFVPRPIGMDAFHLLGQHHPTLDVVCSRATRHEPSFPPRTVGACFGHGTIGMDALGLRPCHRRGCHCMGHGSTFPSLCAFSSVNRCDELHRRSSFEST